MDDTATCHQVRVVNTYLQTQGVTWMQWPTLQPDLNPVENLMDQLDQMLQKRLQPGGTVSDVQISQGKDTEMISKYQCSHIYVR